MQLHKLGLNFSTIPISNNNHLQKKLLRFHTHLTVFERRKDVEKWDFNQAGRLVKQWSDIRNGLEESQKNSNCNFVKRILSCFWINVKTSEELQIEQLDKQVCQLEFLNFQRQFFLDLSLDFIPDLGFEFITSLQMWLKNPEVKGKKIEAARKIVTCKDDVGSNLLNLSLMGLNSLPDCISEISHLQELDLSYNCLKSLPPTLKKLTRLSKLNLSNNAFKQIPEWIGRLKNLKLFNLSYNRLLTLPGNLGHLTNLITLLCSHNDLISIPKSLGNLLWLEYLNLSNNQLGLIPEAVAELYSLKTLILSNNQLRVLPNNLNKFSNLRNLDLNWNFELTELPPHLTNQTPNLCVSIVNTNIPDSQCQLRKRK